MACVILLPVWISATGEKEKHASIRSGILGTTATLDVGDPVRRSLDRSDLNDNSARPGPNQGRCSRAVQRCRNHGLRRPGEYNLTCTAGAYLAGLQWASWGATAAFAQGTMMLDTCIPNCVAGAGHSF